MVWIRAFFFITHRLQFFDDSFHSHRSSLGIIFPNPIRKLPYSIQNGLTKYIISDELLFLVKIIQKKRTNLSSLVLILVVNVK